MIVKVAEGLPWAPHIRTCLLLTEPSEVGIVSLLILYYTISEQ